MGETQECCCVTWFTSRRDRNLVWAGSVSRRHKRGPSRSRDTFACTSNKSVCKIWTSDVCIHVIMQFVKRSLQKKKKKRTQYLTFFLWMSNLRGDDADDGETRNTPRYAVNNNLTYHDKCCFLAFTWNHRNNTSCLNYSILLFFYLKVTH